MKTFKIFSFVAAAALVFGAAACNEIDGPSKKDASKNLVINLSTGTSVVTKAGEVPEFDDERIIRDAQIYIFKASDKSLYRKIDTVFTTPGAGTARRLEENINANEEYIVAAFVNGLSSDPKCKFDGFQNLNQLRSQAIYLASSMPGNNGQFAMYGETGGTEGTSSTISVGVNQTTTANIVVRRFVSRVRLMKVQNKLPEAYGQLTINKVFLINCYSKWNFDGTGSIAGQFSWAGRTDGNSTSSGNIIASASDCSTTTDGVRYPYGAQTYKEYSGVVIDNYWAKYNAQETNPDAASTYIFDQNNGDRFYVFPNETGKDDVTGTSAQSPAASFNGPMPLSTPAPTRLVVVASFNNNGAVATYYYPVTIPNMERNKSYDVTLVISGFGSDDPNREPIKGKIETIINVMPWGGQTEINQEI